MCIDTYISICTYIYISRYVSLSLSPPFFSVSPVDSLFGYREGHLALFGVVWRLVDSGAFYGPEIESPRILPCNDPHNPLVIPLRAPSILRIASALNTLVSMFFSIPSFPIEVSSCKIVSPRLGWPFMRIHADYVSAYK